MGSAGRHCSFCTTTPAGMNDRGIVILNDRGIVILRSEATKDLVRKDSSQRPE